MKKALIFVILALCLVFPANAASAADFPVKNDPKPSFLDSFVSAIHNLFNNKQSPQASSTENEALGESRTKLLKTFNKYELFIRVGVSGSDIYAKKSEFLAKLKESREQLGKATLTTDHKQAILKQLDAIEKVLNLDVSEAPYNKIKSTVLDSFDTLETLTFKMDENEASELLKILQGFNLSI